MGERWFKQAIIYSLDVDTFQDSDGDGVGDLSGLIGRGSTTRPGEPPVCGCTRSIRLPPTSTTATT